MTQSIKRSKYRTLLGLLFTGIAILIVLTNRIEATDKKEEEKKENTQYTVSGRDPKAFSDAAALFKIPSQKLLDNQTTRTILADLKMSYKDGDPWSPQLWWQLDRLRAVRVSAYMVKLLQSIAQEIAVPDRALLQSKTVAAKQAFEQGNRHYEAARFNKAIESYRMTLKDQPAFWDAWNNMALAEMHSNNDLVALFVLSALTKNNPKYAGSSINLSVCLERLGHIAAARRIAAAIVLKQAQMPMANYNMAWFENSHGKYESANTYLLKAMESVSDYAVAKWLQTINSMESGKDITADELKALPQNDQSQGIPKIVSRPVKLAMADAYSGNAIMAKIPKDSQLVISDKAGNWYAFYLPVEDIKRRLWTHQLSLGDKIESNTHVHSQIGTPLSIDVSKTILYIYYTESTRSKAKLLENAFSKIGFKDIKLDQGIGMSGEKTISYNPEKNKMIVDWLILNAADQDLRRFPSKYSSGGGDYVGINLW